MKRTIRTEWQYATYDALWFDYEAQAWVKDGWYVRCGHPEAMNCQCYGKRHEGEAAMRSEGHKALRAPDCMQTV